MGASRSTSQISTNFKRRQFLTGAGAVAALLGARPSLAAVPLSASFGSRCLSFHNLHTGETCVAEYWANGEYVNDELGSIAKVLRDHRNGAVHPIDPALLDLLHKLQSSLETRSPFQVISGYRSPESNAKLAAASSGVAKHSLHMDAKAIDIRVPDVQLTNLHKAAKALKGGGVGYYAASNFVHVDVGRVRYW
jgi:uncharacterized protein YcbK (DUF882 family)